MKQYAITDPGYAELVEKRSKFLCTVCACTSLDEAQEKAARAKKENPKARHVVWAWVGVGGKSRATDDGEPSGTAGVPTQSALVGAGVLNACAITIRYFGGTLLGTGGLSRAYREVCKKAVENATLGELQEYQRARIELPFSEVDTFISRIQKAGGHIEEKTFLTKATLIFAIPKAQYEGFVASYSFASIVDKGGFLG